MWIEASRLSVEEPRECSLYQLDRASLQQDSGQMSTRSWSVCSQHSLWKDSVAMNKSFTMLAVPRRRIRSQSEIRFE